MVTLYEFSVSPFCDKVRRALHLKNIDYRTEKVPLLATVGGSLRRINPARKVPVLVHERETIADSTVILRYLEAKFGGPRLFPDDPRERALCELLEDWADESLYFYQKLFKFEVGQNAKLWVPRFSAFDSAWGRALLSWKLVARQRRQLDAQGLGRKPIAALRDDLARLVGSVDVLVGANDWLVGGSICAADIAVFAQLSALDATPEGAQVVGRYAAVKAWLCRVDLATRPRAEAPAGPAVGARGDAWPAAGQTRTLSFPAPSLARRRPCWRLLNRCRRRE